MSESKTICPYCGRPPGGVHGGVCRRGPEARARLADQMAALGQPRGIYPLKGGFVATRGRRRIDGFNPGVPMVYRPGGRLEGGLPRGIHDFGKLPHECPDIGRFVNPSLPFGEDEKAAIEDCHCKFRVDRREAAAVMIQDFPELGRERPDTPRARDLSRIRYAERLIEENP